MTNDDTVRQLNRRAWDHAVVPDLTPVWAECHRVLVAGGTFISGVLNPDEFVFDDDALDNRGEFVLRHPLSYREIDSLSPEELERQVSSSIAPTEESTSSAQNWPRYHLVRYHR
jgi:hypothetical protein